MELSDEDLVKLGVDDSDIRAKLIEEVKNLPIYEETDHMYVMLFITFVRIIKWVLLVLQNLILFIDKFLLQKFEYKFRYFRNN